MGKQSISNKNITINRSHYDEKYMEVDIGHIIRAVDDELQYTIIFEF